jgi:tetratricopeptide (TPR) repeat protein
MATKKPPAKLLPFERPRRFPADLDRLRTLLDDEEAELEETDIDEGLACAEAAIARAVPGGPEAKADLLTIRAHRTRAAGDLEAALAVGASAIAACPSCLQAYVLRAQILEKRGAHEAALAELDGFVERFPVDAKGYLERAKLHEGRADGERALANFRRAVQLDPTLFDVHLSMAQALAAKGDADGASRAYAKYAQQTLGDAESYNLRAFMFFVSGQDELALADYEASVALAPNDPETLAWRGLCRSKLGHLDAAIADFTRLVALTPLEARGYLRRAGAFRRAGRRAEALRDLDRAIALEPGNAQAYQQRSALHVGMGDTLAAKADLVRAFELAPEDPEIRASYGRMQAMSSKTDEARGAAMRLIESSVQLDPEKHETWSLLAYRLRDAGFYAEAIPHITRAIELDPDNADYFDERATLIRQCADPTHPAAFQRVVLAALADAERAIALSGDREDLELYRQRASLREESGDLAGSIADHTKMTEIAPWFIDAVMDRERLLKLRGGVPPP